MLNAKEIKELVRGGEGYNVDFKSSVPSKVRDITAEVCSFANSTGGYVIIGVNDSNQIIGVEINNSKRSSIQGSIGEISPALHFEMYSVKIEEKEVWVIDVPSGKSRPYVFSGSVYVREGPNCQKLTTVEEIRDLFQQSDRIYFDTIPCPKIDLSQILDKENFKEFRTAAQLSRNISDGQILENLQVYDEDNVVKRGGVLFFAEHPENLYFQIVVRCVLFKGIDKVYIIDDKTFGGPLLQQYNKAIEWLKGKLQVAYEIEGTGPRKEIWEIPLTVFKESIINALSHRDYYEQGACITIEMFDNRVEITNPGGLLPIIAKNFGRKSLSRNPLIFGLFTRMNLVERIASGIPRMKKDMVEAGLPEPLFETEGMFTVIFYRSSKTTDTATLLQEIDLELTDNQIAILNSLKDNPSLTMNEISELTKLSRTAIYNNIKILKDNGYIIRMGRKSDGWWKVLK